MKNKTLKIPAIILIVGFIAAIAAYLLTGIIKMPTITEQDFNYSVTYKLNGETQIYEGVYRCRFEFVGEGIDPLERYYEGEYLSNPDDGYSAAYTIAKKDGLKLCIVNIFSNEYLMGDGEEGFLDDPYLAVYDKDGIEYVDTEMLEKFDAELISWENPEPIENSFVFAGFARLHSDSMVAMLFVALLVIVACMILVKRDKYVPYKALDKVAVVLNYIIVFVAIPFFALVVGLMPIYVSGEELIYQIDLCVPAITAFAVAASIALRRKGFTKPGFFVQFIGPILFVLLTILESVL